MQFHENRINSRGMGMDGLFKASSFYVDSIPLNQTSCLQPGVFDGHFLRDAPAS